MSIPMKQIVLVIIIFAILVNLGPFGSIGHQTEVAGDLQADFAAKPESRQHLRIWKVE